MPAPVIDWIVAEWIAGRMAGNGHAPSPEIDLVPIAADAEQRVVAYTGLTPTAPLPPPEGLSRKEWVATNIASTRALIDPMLERLTGRVGPAQAGGRAVARCDGQHRGRGAGRLPGAARARPV